ncbi:hypothetical protein APHAL10511_008049 [Amanita phalloides]|nr:hypothetical protein APHAL10511_008049 [Amanita phalloides]
MPSSRNLLHVIPEDEEPRSLSSSSSSRASSPWLEAKRTFSTSFIEVSLADEHYLPSSAPRPLATLPRNMVYEIRSGAISPTPSASSLSSSSPPTPTSSEDESSPLIIEPRHASIRPLNITKNNVQKRVSHRITLLESEDSEDESDSEWYTQEFSKMIWPLPPSLPKQQPSRPESLRLEPVMTEEPVTRSPNPPKRAFSHMPKRSRSIPKAAPPPVPTIPIPAIPTQSSPPPPGSTSIPEIVELPRSASPVNQSHSRTLSFRRPPPRTSIPNDCHLITDENQSFWSSDFDLPIHEEPSPVDISPPSSCPSSHLTVPQIPDSPGSMYSQLSAFPHQSFVDIEDSAEIEFAVDDIKFDLSTDLPLRLPLSLPNSPTDLEADFAFGLEELWGGKATGASPVIAITDADEKLEEQLESAYVRSEPSSLPTTPSSNSDAELYPLEQVTTPDKPTLRSRWSNSTLGSVCEDHTTRSKFGAANKLKLYFGGGSPLTKSKQSQQQQEKREKEHKRPGSTSPIAAAKAAVARATTGAIHHPSSPSSPSRRSSSFIPLIPASPASPKTKKAQRQVVIVPPSSFYPRRSRTPASAFLRDSLTSSPVPSLSGKSKKGWDDQEGDVMVIGYGLGGLGKGLKRHGSH